MLGLLRGDRRRHRPGRNEFLAIQVDANVEPFEAVHAEDFSGETTVALAGRRSLQHD